jgi:predicted secreted protein
MYLLKVFALFVFTMIIVTLSGSCISRTPESTTAPKEVQLTQDGGACGSGVGLNEGDTLVLVMDGNSSSGYTWEVGYYVPAVIKPEGEQAVQSGADLASASDTSTFRFVAVGEGQAELLMVYEPLDEDLPDLGTCQVDVTVK